MFANYTFIVVIGIQDIDTIINDYIIDLKKWDIIKNKFMKNYVDINVRIYGFKIYNYLYDDLLFKLVINKYPYFIYFFSSTSIYYDINDDQFNCILENINLCRHIKTFKRIEKYIIDSTLRYCHISERSIIKLIRNKKITNKRWHYISQHQKLSEKFIYKYRNQLNWYHINKRYNLANCDELDYYIKYMHFKCYRKKFRS